MAKPRLQRIRQRKTAGMSQHVWMDRKWHLRPLTQARDERVEAFRRHRATALGSKDMWPSRLLAL
jgi:uncharacterized protein (DUF2384 family)